ncbi:MAG: efflux RND transporter periplasmic adaptor subunit [Gemmatimonadales bacterium]|nr:efflux RND transporter periplasmic adaptor subunit [Gemmatimonadales bacterium]NIQ99432.1 efflux RND transporter periplasmic adaptor subunit [Gemmatimonadales bacterium]NIS64100.1 efflux RND transporter periplasmic adaptor subunit [Gemmatimonadales bacterium]
MSPPTWRSGGLLALLTAAAVGCSSAGGGEETPDYPFRVNVADRGAIRVTIEETGVVEPERQITVKSPISGVVRRLHIRAGDSVRAGQLMATIVPDIAQANALAQLRSEISGAEISVGNLRREYERAKELRARSLISESDVEASRVAAEQAENQLRAAQERLRLIEESGVQATDVTQSARIVAPSAGVVIMRGVEEGETVVGGTSTFGGGTELFTIADLSTLLILAAINEVDIGKVKAGDTVAITVDAFPGDTASGVVRLVPPAARQQERIRVFDVEIEVRSGADILRPGMTANVQIAGPTRENVVRVPVEAVFFSEGQPIVYRLENGNPQRTPVTLGLSDLSYVEILDGVAEGDSVALDDPIEAARRARTRGGR